MNPITKILNFIKSNILFDIGKKINHFISNIFVIDPASNFKLIWDLF